jgi:DNA mismatch endonuclease (patch repair protein)
MRRIRRRDTAPELELRRALWGRGLRYRLDYKTPAGRCDIAFPGKRVAVFVDGCFWHGCPEHYVRPRSQEGFWAAKLRGNVDRDRRQTLELERREWTVLRFWEHEVRTDTGACAERAARAVAGARRSPIRHWCVVKVVPLDEESTRERRYLEELRHVRMTRVVDRRRSRRRRR